MECVCEMMPFPHPPQAHTFYLQQSQQPAIYQPYMQHPQQMEEFVVRYGAPEYAEFGYPHPAYYEEFDDMSGEPSTRPRLTKDQVEVLEAQFQANHKPSSVVKRQLAMQTMLTLPRVAVSHFSSQVCFTKLCIELVSEPTSKGKAAEEAGRV